MLLFGSLFALFSDPKNAGTVFSEGAFWHGVVFTTIFNGAVMYAISYYPDWMWMYFTEGVKNTWPELVYIFVFLYYLPYVLGYYMGRDVKKFSAVGVWGLMGLLAAAEVWIIFHLFDRYAVVGTRADFINGTALSLFGRNNPLGIVMNGAVAAMVLYFIFVLYLYKHRRKKQTLS